MAAPALALTKKHPGRPRQLIHIVPAPARSPELLAYFGALKIIRDAMWEGDGLSYDGIIAAAGIGRYLVNCCKANGMTSAELKGGCK